MLMISLALEKKSFKPMLFRQTNGNYHIGFEDISDVMFVGPALLLGERKRTEQYIRVDQERCCEELGEIEFVPKKRRNRVL